MPVVTYQQRVEAIAAAEKRDKILLKQTREEFAPEMARLAQTARETLQKMADLQEQMMDNFMKGGGSRRLATDVVFEEDIPHFYRTFDKVVEKVNGFIPQAPPADGQVAGDV